MRREIRSLNDADRAAIIGAMGTIWQSTDAEAGRAKYGPRFVSVAEMMKQHLAALTATGCSPVHEYMSFITAHNAFGLQLELAMQVRGSCESSDFWSCGAREMVGRLTPPPRRSCERWHSSSGPPA